MPASYQLKIITKEKIAFEGEVESVTAPASEGSLGIWANHAPLITALVPGKLSYRTLGANDTSVEIESGYLEVRNNLVTILTDKMDA